MRRITSTPTAVSRSPCIRSHCTQRASLELWTVYWFDLRKDFFCAGMLYVALSRVRRSQDVLILRNRKDDEIDTDNISQMPFSVTNPFPQEALDFANSAGVVAGEQTVE